MVGGPAGAGLGLKAGTTAATIAPIAAGMATGAAVAGAKGDDIGLGALTGGLGGFGGGNLAGSVGKMGAQGGYEAGKTISAGVPETTAAGMDALDTAANPFFGAADTMPKALTNTASAAAEAIPTTYSQGMSQLGRGATALFQPEGFEKFTTPISQGGAGGSMYQIGTPLAMAGLSGAQEDLFPEPDTSEEEKRKKEARQFASTDPDYILNLSADTGLRLASGGAVPGSGSVFGTQAYQQDSSNAYNRPDGTAAQNTPAEAYGIGRLDNLFNQGASAKAANEFYAEGGPVAFAKGGNTGLPSLNLNNLPSLNLNTGMQSYGRPEMMQKIITGFGNMGASHSNPGVRKVGDFMSRFFSNDPAIIDSIRKGKMPQGYAEGGKQQAQYAQGGYLDGQGDGMSDSIPASIEGQQPARLADGEFVVPADVVSHIGNGSSKAGAQRLYKMLHKVRKARTGNPKQGKQINPNKYLPA
jgi:hypothetical protein